MSTYRSVLFFHVHNICPETAAGYCTQNKPLICILREKKLFFPTDYIKPFEHRLFITASFLWETDSLKKSQPDVVWTTTADI